MGNCNCVKVMAQPGKVHYKKTQEILDNYLKNYHKELLEK